MSLYYIILNHNYCMLFSTRRYRVTVGDGIIKHCENLIIVSGLEIIPINYSSFREETQVENPGCFFYTHSIILIISVLLVSIYRHYMTF